MAGTAAAARPLTDDERKVMDELLRRAGMTAKPVQKAGSQYQALVNLSQPRAGDKDKQTDRVMRGEILTLTDDEAALWLPPCKPFPHIRPAAQQNDPLPRITHAMLSGNMRLPAYARPDPAGATMVQVIETVPEASQVYVGSENEDGPSIADQQAAILDAIDTKVKR